MDVPIGDDHRPAGEVRADEGVGVVKSVGSEQTRFFKWRFVAEFDRLQRQLSEFAVPPRLVGHHDLRKGKFVQQLAEDSGGFALP